VAVSNPISCTLEECGKQYTGYQKMFATGYLFQFAHFFQHDIIKDKVYNCADKLLVTKASLKLQRLKNNFTFIV
jgi:hypothetical protein